MLAKSHTEIDVYKKAFAASMTIFELSREWPREERYSLTDQIRKCSRSVCANFAEGWARRRYPAHFASKMTDSLAECKETMTWLNFAAACGYLAPDDHRSLVDAFDHIAGLVYKMAEAPAIWCPPR